MIVDPARTAPGRLSRNGAAFTLAALFAVMTVSCAGVPGRKTDVPDRLDRAEGPILMFAPGRHNRLGPTDSSIMVWHFTPRGGRAWDKIRFRKEGEPDRSLTASRTRRGDRRLHRFVLKGLSPSTRYLFDPPPGGAAPGSFTTGPPAGARASFRVLCLGDTGSTIDGDGSFSYFSDVLDAAGAHYEKAGTRPAFFLHLGDMVRRGTEPGAWKSFFDSLSSHPFTGPAALVPGNHEFWGDYGAAFRFFTDRPLYYSFEYGGALFLCVHARESRRGKERKFFTELDRAQLRFLERELTRWNGRGWTVLSIHHAILSTGDFGVNATLSAQLLGLLRRHRVDLVLSGHDHIFDSFHADRKADWGGTLFIVAGTGGSKLDHYIMTRQKRRWRSWKNRGRFCRGLEPHHKEAARAHIHGELSWGFTDIAFGEDALEVTYHRWLSLPRFLRVTKQTAEKCVMVPLDEKARKDLKAVPAVKIRKKRAFPR